VITVYSDRSFTFIMKTPTGVCAHCQALGLAKGSATRRTRQSGKRSPASSYEDIAKMKMPDLTASDLDAAVRTIAGSARSMGVDVEGV